MFQCHANVYSAFQYNVRALRGERLLEYETSTTSDWASFCSHLRLKFALPVDSALNLGYKFYGRDPVRAPYIDLAGPEDFGVLLKKVVEIKQGTSKKATIVEVCDRVCD